MTEENPREEVAETPRPPTPSEIAQAILDHVTNQQIQVNNFSGGYRESLAEDERLSIIEYFGPQIGYGVFELPWPTTPLPQEEADE